MAPSSAPIPAPADLEDMPPGFLELAWRKDCFVECTGAEERNVADPREETEYEQTDALEHARPWCNGRAA